MLKQKVKSITLTKPSSGMNTQIVLMQYDNKVYYGELSDAHVFRGAERNLVVEDNVCITMPSDWKIYLDSLPYINIEKADGTWIQAGLHNNHNTAVQTTKGYIMPILELQSRELATAYPVMRWRKDVQPSIQGHAPSALVRTAAKPVATPVKKTRFISDDGPLVSAKPLSTPAKPMAAPARQTVIVNGAARARVRRSSTSSTDAVSKIVPVARAHKSGAP